MLVAGASPTAINCQRGPSNCEIQLISEPDATTLGLQSFSLDGNSLAGAKSLIILKYTFLICKEEISWVKECQKITHKGCRRGPRNIAGISRVKKHH